MKKRGRKPYSKELAEDVRWYYKNTSCSVTRIASHFGISSTTVDHMISKTGAYKDKINPRFKFNLKPKLSWLILDGRAWDDPDKACVYCAYDSRDSKLAEVYKDRDEDWPDGVIFEYEQHIKKEYDEKLGKDKFTTYILNKKLLG